MTRIEYVMPKGSCRSVTQSCPTLRDPVDCSTPDFPCPSPSPGACSNSYPLSRWCHLTISTSAAPFPFCFQSFSASGSFPVRQFSASGGQCTRASVSALPILDWFPLEVTGLISLWSKGLSRVFFSSAVQKHKFFSAQSYLWSNFHIHTWPWL